MSRGKGFKHKLKGYEHETPEHGKHVPPKHTKAFEYEIEPTAKDGHGPVSIVEDKR